MKKLSKLSINDFSETPIQTSSTSSSGGMAYGFHCVSDGMGGYNCHYGYEWVGSYSAPDIYISGFYGWENWQYPPYNGGGGSTGGGSNTGGMGSGGGSSTENNTPIRVFSSGDSLIGTIAEALRRLKKNVTVESIRSFIAANYRYTPGQGVESEDVLPILNHYFNIYYASSERQVVGALNNKQLVIANETLMKRAVLVDGCQTNSTTNTVSYNYYNSVDGRNGYNATFDFDQYQFFIIMSVK